MLSDCENNLERIGTISVAQCFRTQAGMLSGPDTFFVSTLSNSWTPTVEIEYRDKSDQYTWVYT